MKIKELKKVIKNLPDKMDVVYGWQFNDVLHASVETQKINGKSVTALRIIDDPDLIDDEE